MKKRTDHPTGPKKYGVRYPWRGWYKTGRFRLIRGKDFVVSLDGMVQMTKDWASKLRLAIEYDVDRASETIWVRVVGKLPPRKLRRK